MNLKRLSYRVCHECTEGSSDTVRILPALDRDEEDKDEPDWDVDLHHVWHVDTFGQSHEPADRCDNRLPPVKTSFIENMCALCAAGAKYVVCI